MKGGLYVLAGLLFLVAGAITLYYFWWPFWDTVLQGGITALLLFGGLMLLVLGGVDYMETRKTSQKESS